MAEFETWAENGPTEEPTATEFDQGFNCERAPRDLFNWLFQQIARDKQYARSLAFYRSAIAVQNDPPSNPSDGDTYIVGTAPTGIWANNANKVAEFRGDWRFIAPAPWMLVGLADQTDLRWDHVAAPPSWVRVDISRFADETEHLAGVADDLMTHPTGVAAMITTAIGNLPPDQVLGFADVPTHLAGTEDSKAAHPAGVAAMIVDALDGLPAGGGSLDLATTNETVAGTLTTKATHPAGVRAAIDARTGSNRGYNIRAFRRTSGLGAPSSAEWPNAPTYSIAFVFNSSDDNYQFYRRQSSAWYPISAANAGGGGGAPGALVGAWLGNPLAGTATAGYAHNLTWLSAGTPSSGWIAFQTAVPIVNGLAMTLGQPETPSTAGQSAFYGTSTVNFGRIGNAAANDTIYLRQRGGLEQFFYVFSLG